MLGEAVQIRKKSALNEQYRDFDSNARKKYL
jgi:hypothetical protein